MIHHHLVQPGDTLSGIARDLNSTVAAIQLANGIADPNRIFVGDVLHVPVVAVQPPPPPPPDPDPDPEPPPPPPPPPPGNEQYLWADIGELPTEGPAWASVESAALGSWGSPNISNQDSNHNVMVLAGAMYAARTGASDVRARVITAIEDAIGTEAGGRTLALARNLTAYVLAADYVGYRTSRFEDWLDGVRHANLDGRTLISTHEDRPNNWGTHASTARIAAALYLGDAADLARAVTVFRGFLGDRSAYAGFTYGDTSWQADPSNPVGINPKGASKDGHNIDGVIPDDQRRTGSFEWPAPKGSYPWEGMQGIVATAVLLHRNGYPDVWEWSNGAIHRAAHWLVSVNDNPPSGDDNFLRPLLGLPYDSPVGHGKAVGWTDWTHSR